MVQQGGAESRRTLLTVTDCGQGPVQVIAENKEKGDCFIRLHIPEARQRARQRMINKCACVSNQLTLLETALLLRPGETAFSYPSCPLLGSM